MATSGSSNFQQTRNALIEDAFSLIGVNAVGKTLSAEDTQLASRFLNKMVKAWATKGLHLWSKAEGVLYLTQYESQYTLSDASTSAYWTTKADEIVAKLTASASASATTLALDSTSGMTVADKIGVVLDTGALFWTTISAIPSSTSVTLSSGITTAAASANLVFSFTTRAGKPLKIHSVRRITGYDEGASTSQTEIPIGIQSYDTFNNIAMGTINGIPNQCTFNPNTLSSEFYIWPRPTSCSDRLAITYERVIQDLDNPGDDFDFPAEWEEALTYQLATRLGPIYGKDARVMQSIAPLASTFLQNLLDWDNENTSIQVTMDTGESYND